MKQSLKFLASVSFIASCIWPLTLAQTVSKESVWVARWGTSQQIPEPQNALPYDDLRDATVRQIFHLSVGGPALRVHLSNAFGTEALRFTSVHIARKTWTEIFGDASGEVFMAWNYARYIQAVAAQGKHEYPLPMYVNCQLPAPAERAGEYPSGGPHPYYLEVYRVTAPSLDFYSPDIYWPNFEYWIDRYKFKGNAVFVPEARLESAPYNAFYAYGEAKAFGFSPFGIESLQNTPDASASGPTIEDTYEVLASISDILLSHQPSQATRGVVLHSNSPRPGQTVALGNYLFEATLSRSWPAKTLLTDDGAMLIVQSIQNEFYIAGTGLTVSFFRNPDVDSAVSRIASIEEVSRPNGSWITLRRLNGDQTNQGHQLLMPPHQVRLYRVLLYSTSSTTQGR